MLNFDKSISVLEFDKVLEMLAAVAPTEGDKKRALALQPTSNKESVVRRQTFTADAKYMVGIKGAPSFGNMPDILDSVENAEKNSVLSPREILDVASVLHTTRSLIEYIHTDALKRCALTEFFDVLVPNKPLEDRIVRAIIGEDLIADEASPALAEILQNYLLGDNAKHLRDTIVTMRNGRYVLPVKSENRNEIKGLVHDTSGTGATLFIEPMSVVEANNELRTLMGQEQTEIERILAEFSADIANFAMQLFNNYRNITEIGFYFACAELSYKMNAIEPKINDKKIVVFERARHPLLNKETVVPINISIGEGYRMLVVTGPNTGGKTVTLKTLGLFALMAQSGLQLPADRAEICIFDGVFPDIGDEQSIEQSLSTFSAHMLSVVKILENMTPDSLVLFDELGAGTDPIEGAALAQSILERVLSEKCLCAGTTHYAELKAFALNTEGVSNASCEFDVNTLKPTYKLIIGAPGKSNAFLISSKLGVSEEIVKRASELTSDDSKSFESVIGKLEESRIALENEKEEAKRLREEYEAFKLKAEKELKDKLSRAEKDAEKMVKKAQEMISGAKVSTEYIFDRLDKLQKEKDSKDFGKMYADAKKDLRNRLNEADDIYNPVEEVDDNYVLPRPLVKGDTVILRNLGTEGVLLDDPDKQGNVNVKSGIAKTKTNISNLILVTEKKTDKKKEKPQSRTTAIVSKDFSISIDVRGKNIEEAWIDVDKYFDEALYSGIKSVTVVHGKGTGVLRKGLWEFFRKDQRVKKYRHGEFGEGDFGVTIVEFK